jgi:hypothetical protein
MLKYNHIAWVNALPEDGELRNQHKIPILVKRE